MKALILVGSTRQGRKTIHAAEYAAEAFRDSGHTTELFDLEKRDIPFMQERRRYLEDVPEDIEVFGEKVEECDVLIIVSPEYNHSFPGVLKNALDYLYPEYHGKPFAYITTSGGGFGGVRGLSHLHDFTLAVNAHPGPNLPVSNIGSVFNEEGGLEDEDYRSRFSDYVEKVEDHVEKVS
ncbi:MAG: NADPH-dependent FMN reductase [Candidatus Nanohaloarchaea archaeon]